MHGVLSMDHAGETSRKATPQQPAKTNTANQPTCGVALALGGALARFSAAMVASLSSMRALALPRTSSTSLAAASARACRSDMRASDSLRSASRAACTGDGMC